MMLVKGEKISMITLRVLKHEDYDDAAEISKYTWDNTDYLPALFHQWVDDPLGLFIGAIDTTVNKVVGTDKYSVFSDSTGWLEGLRVHKDYRGKKIAKLMTEYLMEHATGELNAEKIQRIAFATHMSSVESINIMEKYNFQIEQRHVLVRKEFDKLEPGIKKSDFIFKLWNATYEEFSNLPFTKRRNGVFHLAFYFQKPTKELFNYLKEHNCFVNINGYNGIYLFKGDPHFITEEESFEAIDTFSNYYLLTLKDSCNCPPFFSVIEQDKELIEKLKAKAYFAENDWISDYYYFVMK